MRITILLIISICIVLTVNADLFAQDSLNVEQVGQISNHWDPAWEVVVVGDLAYVAAGLSGLQIVDVSDPENPELIGDWEIPSFAFGIAISGNYAYIANGMGGLHIVSIADPEHPERAGFYGIDDWYAYDVTVSDDYAYVADVSGLRVISIADPEHPEEVGHYDTPGAAMDVALSEDGLIYVVYGSNMGIYRFTDPNVVYDDAVSIPAKFNLYAAFPNPFNQSTTISYSLPHPGNVSLQVYNLSGQRITTLFEGNKQPGIHSTNLTANDLPSGLYFVRLKASDQVLTQKVMLIR